MDPQATVTRAVWQEKVRQLIGMGYPLDAAYAAAAQQVGTPDFNTSLNQVSAPGDQSAAVPPAALGQPNPQAQQAIADVTAPGKPTPPTPPPIRDNASADYPGRPPKNNGGTPPAGGAGSQGGSGQPPSTGSNQSSTNDVVQPGQGGAGAAPAQASDPNQAGPQAAGSAYPGTTPSEVNTQFYELGANDTPATLAQRIFKGGGAGSNIPGFGGQNFYDERVTGSPWGQFLQSRYAPEVQSDLTLGRLAGGDDSAQSNMNMARSVLQNVANGNGAPAGGGMSALKSMAGDLSNFDPNNTTGMSQSQASTLRQLYNDPSAQAQTILGQMQGQTGGWGMNFLRNQLANQAQLSYNNPSQNPMNTFASRVLPMIGMGGGS